MARQDERLGTGLCLDRVSSGECAKAGQALSATRDYKHTLIHFIQGT